MAIEVFSRYEKKFLLDEKTYRFITDRIGDYMVVDKYNQDKEFYNIANIYYDTPNDALIRASIEKPVYKEKLRLRSYGVPALSDKVFLEIKKKYKGLVNKRRTKLILSEAYDLTLNGIKPQEAKHINKQVLSEIEYFLSLYDLQPKVYLTYDRRAYFATDDRDFRVTFDTNIRSRREDVRLEAGNHGDLLIGNDFWLMEVKSSEAVPLWFTKILSEAEIYPTSFSKYGTEYKKNLIKEKNIKGDNKICLPMYLKQQIQQQQQAQSCQREEHFSA
ncbi:MAG: polyphosphate polymerase domain-containing protein [Lachnospiraceae bacterium]|nr:polyphosphate polymerase domain-containing protein [Lachnospiraceae bacterium]